MKLIRISVVTLVAVAVLALAVPAQARGIEKPQPSIQSQGGVWLAYSLDNALNHAMTWLARLAGNETPAVRQTMKSTTPLPPPTGVSGPYYTPQTGCNIDPLGRCNQ